MSEGGFDEFAPHATSGQHDAWVGHGHEYDESNYWGAQESAGDHSDTAESQAVRPALEFWSSVFRHGIPQINSGMVDGCILSATLPLPLRGWKISVVQNFGQSSHVLDMQPSTSPTEAENLPSHITKIYDEEAGHHYYYNSQTQQSSWVYPASTQLDSRSSSIPQERPPSHKPEAQLQSAQATAAFDDPTERFGFSLEASREPKQRSATERLDITYRWYCNMIHGLSLSGAVCNNQAWRIDGYCGNTYSASPNAVLSSFHIERGSGPDATLGGSATLTTRWPLTAESHRLDVLFGLHVSYAYQAVRRSIFKALPLDVAMMLRSDCRSEIASEAQQTGFDLRVWTATSDRAWREAHVDANQRWMCAHSPNIHAIQVTVGGTALLSRRPTCDVPIGTLNAMCRVEGRDSGSVSAAVLNNCRVARAEAQAVVSDGVFISLCAVCPLMSFAEFWALPSAAAKVTAVAEGFAALISRLSIRIEVNSERGHKFGAILNHSTQ